MTETPTATPQRPTADPAPLPDEPVQEEQAGDEPFRDDRLSGEPARAEPVRDELFPGDTGVLPLKLRQALIRLLHGPYLDGAAHEKVFRTIVDNRQALRSRLSELFLVLVIDEDRKIALLRPAEVNEPFTQALARQRELSREETLLLLRMRLILDRHQGTGTDAVISRAEVLEVFEHYLDPARRDAKSVEDLADATIRKLVHERRLLLTTELAESFVISNALPLALPYENIGDIVKFMDAIARTPGADPGEDSDADLDMEPGLHSGSGPDTGPDTGSDAGPDAGEVLL